MSQNVDLRFSHDSHPYGSHIHILNYFRISFRFRNLHVQNILWSNWLLGDIFTRAFYITLGSFKWHREDLYDTGKSCMKPGSFIWHQGDFMTPGRFLWHRGVFMTPGSFLWHRRIRVIFVFTYGSFYLKDSTNKSIKSMQWNIAKKDWN